MRPAVFFASRAWVGITQSVMSTYKVQSMSLVELTGIKKVFRAALTPHEPTVAFWLDQFRVAEGEHTALVGPSGCGKSTLLNLISGVVRPQAGCITVAGMRVDQLAPGQIDRFRGRTIGYVFQQFNLVDALTALENVLLGLRLGRAVPRIQWSARARELLDRVGLGHRRNYRPGQLSIGEQQRVAIARALANHPAILLADEPTGSLDPTAAAQIFQLLLDSCRDGAHTLIVVTHDPAIANRVPHQFDCSHLVHESDGPQ